MAEKNWILIRPRLIRNVEFRRICLKQDWWNESHVDIENKQGIENGSNSAAGNRP